MSRLNPRRVFTVSAALFGVVGVVAACSSEEGGNAPAPVSESPDAGVGAEAAASPDVIVTLADRWAFGSGKPIDVPSTRKVVSATISTKASGSEQIIQGTVRPDGAVVFAGVPSGPYVLELRLRFATDAETDPPTLYSYPIDGARAVRLGGNYWGRKDAAPMTAATKLALTLNVPAQLKPADSFEWLGLSSYFYRYARFAPVPDGLEPNEGETNTPAADATMSSEWTFEERALEQPYGPEASGLPAAGDDLQIVQSRATNVALDGDRFVPWNRFVRTEAIGVLDVPSPGFKPDTTNTVTGTLAAPPKENVSFAIKGTTFAAMRETQVYPLDARARARLTASHEIGQGPGYLTSVAPVSWDIRADSRPNVLVPECFKPDSYVCSPQLCPDACPAAWSGYVDPGDIAYSFEAPKVVSTGFRDVYDFSYQYYFFWSSPEGSKTLSASATIVRPKSGATAPFALELGPVSNVKVRGQLEDGGQVPELGELTWDGKNVVPLPPVVVPTVTVSFDKPTLGTPEYYELNVVDLPMEGSARTVARIFTRETTVTIPKGVLQRDRYYYFRIYAVRDGKDFAEPSVTKTDSRMATGTFTPGFVFTDPTP